MSTIDRIMHALGWQRVEQAQSEGELARLTDGGGEQYRAFIDQAVEMAKLGALLDERTLYAVCTLAATRQMTPGTEQALHQAGIDTTPWAVMSAHDGPGQVQ